MVAEKEFNAPNNHNQDGTTKETRDEIAGHIKFPGEVKTILKNHCVYEYRNLRNANEVSVFVISHKDSARIIDYRTNTKETNTVWSHVYWPLVWANQALDEEPDLNMTETESLQLLLSFIKIGDRMDTDMSVLMRHWSDITRERDGGLRFTDADSMVLDTNWLYKSSHAIVPKIPLWLRKEITAPVVRESGSDYVINLYIPAMDGAVHHITVDVHGNRYSLRSSMNLGVFGVPIFID